MQAVDRLLRVQWDPQLDRWRLERRLPGAADNYFPVCVLQTDEGGFLPLGEPVIRWLHEHDSWNIGDWYKRFREGQDDADRKRRQRSRDNTRAMARYAARGVAREMQGLSPQGAVIPKARELDGTKNQTPRRQGPNRRQVEAGAAA